MYINIPGDKQFCVKHSVEEAPQQQNFPMHAHSHFELLYFVSGDVTYMVEGNSYHPAPHDILLFDVAETHRVIVHSSSRYERIVVQFEKNLFSAIDPENTLLSAFTERKCGENNVIHPSHFKDDMWQKCIKRLAQSDDPNELDLYTYLLPLLREIHSNIDSHTKEVEQPMLPSRVIQYINEHITEDISPSEIANRFFISRTALYKLFRDATGTSVHNYINVKRLIIAQDLLRGGESPTKVFERCGFKDYTTFFRAYKSHFAVSPKVDAKRFGHAR